MQGLRSRPGRRVAAVGALAVVALVGGLALRVNPMPRSALWLVIRGCVLMQERFDTPFPCLRVVPDGADGPGYAVLRAQGHPTHVIVTPIVPISGIESEAVLRRDAGSYWRAALAARRDAEDGAIRPIAAGDMGLAINSRLTRSQDQLHIHAECLERALLSAARSQSFKQDGWEALNRPVDDEGFLGRLVHRQDIERGNLFQLLATLPAVVSSSGESVPDGTVSGIGDVAAFLVPILGEGTDERFLLLASRTRRRSIERLLDDTCSAASPG